MRLRVTLACSCIAGLSPFPSRLGSVADEFSITVWVFHTIVRQT
jgi:hypothetical protein